MKEKTLIILLSIILFLILDYVVSRNTNLFHVKKDCFEFIKKQINDKNYFHYNLKKNCFAIEHKGVSKSYDVYSNQIGSRVKNNEFKKINKKEKIIFLGDSFTYGFGLNYEESIPGLIDKKTKNKYEIINFGFMGYSPSMNYYLLKNYINSFPDIKIKKVFYILDITDVHDESNRWIDIDGIEVPVIFDKLVEDEIKKNFDIRNKFRTIRYISYLVNKNVRNLKKNIKKNFYIFKKNEKNILKRETPSYWAKFIYTPKKDLNNDKNYSSLWLNNEEYGMDKIKKKIIEMSKLLKEKNIDFYIAIHPWKEVLEFGQSEFSWENFANDLCIKSECKKLVNLFPVIQEIKSKDPLWKSKIYFKDDIHFSIYGNEIYSKKIYQESF